MRRRFDGARGRATPARAVAHGTSLSALINDLLKKDIELIEGAKQPYPAPIGDRFRPQPEPFQVVVRPNLPDKRI